MRPRLQLTWLLALATLLVACDATPQQPPGPRADADGILHYGRIRFEPCSLDGQGNTSVRAQCATLQVAEDPDAPEGRQIGLAIALVPASGLAEADPVFMIAGGPGQSALETYPQLHGAFADVRRNRHVVLVDARGTGGSNPLHCPLDVDDPMLTLDGEEAAAAAREFTRRCRDTLEEVADLRFYTTADHVRDLEAVRRALGAPQVNLVGVSYGTRVAQQYAASHPQHARALVLDSVVPNSLVLGQDHARNLEDALEVHFARCREDGACAANLGDPREQLDLVRARLEAGGIAPVRYRDPVDGQWREDVPRFGHLAGVLRMYPYQPTMASVLPLLLHEAGQGRYESLLAQSRMMYRNLGESIAMGMSLSVTCSEDAQDFDPDAGDADTVLGTAFLSAMEEQCGLWPRGTRGRDFRAPLQGEVPVLAISGEFDPVTPPRYGDEVVEHLPNGRHLVLPGQGHSVLSTGCMPKLFAQFIESTDAAALDASCLERLRPTPPFAGYYGWEP